jgi:O-antigen/teichoic acid export membrane protein
LNKKLNSQSKTAFFWDFSGAFVKQFAGLFISIILARLLGPKEFGLIGISLVFIHISQVFIDAGFSIGLVQQKKTKDITFSSIFYINICVSLVLSSIIILTSGLIADFYNEPKVKSMLILLAIVPPIAAMGNVQGAILIKKMDFKSLTIRNIVSTVFGGLLGVAAVFLDYGVYSLVIQQIAMATATTLMMWFATKWRPKLEYSHQEVKKLFSYSSFIFFDQLMIQIVNKMDIIFIAKVFSPIVLGYYSRAESLKSQVQRYATSSLRKIAFPVLSQLQDDNKKFKETYFKFFNISSGFVVYLIAPIYFLSQFIIIFLFGNQWQPTVILFQILLLTALSDPQVNIMGVAIAAKGYSKLKFKIGIFQRLLKLLPISVGLFYGIKEFAVAMVIASFLIFLMLSIFYQKKLDIKFWLQIKSFLIPNSLFLALIIIHYYFKNDISQWWFVSFFLILQTLFMIIIKHESYIFFKSNFSKILKKINIKIWTK